MELSGNFFYLKDVNFEQQNSKDLFSKYNDVSICLKNINKDYFTEFGVSLEDKFEVYYL